MTTTSTVKVKLDDRECGIASTGGAEFTFQDGAGNQVAISLPAVLRCLSIAEVEKRFQRCRPNSGLRSSITGNRGDAPQQKHRQLTLALVLKGSGAVPGR